MSYTPSYSDKTMISEEELKRSALYQLHLQKQQTSFNFKNIMTKVLNLFSPLNLVFSFFISYIYQIYQSLLHYLFSPKYIRPSSDFKPLGRIAIIGAGLTRISSAAHLKDHGFEVVIYESDSKVGGIWSRVNSTSSLQLNSILYRFHPSIVWQSGFPKRDEIVDQIEQLWKRYELQSSTRFNTRVNKVSRHLNLSTDPKKGGHGRWCINEGEDGVFDSVIVSTGTCGSPRSLESTHIFGQESFKGSLLHSSKLDDARLSGKRVVIVGSGASAVEAAEFAIAKGAEGITILARSNKWIIPRNTIFDILLALQPFGRETPLSFIPEYLIKKFHYGKVENLAPLDKGLFEGTPIVNDEFLAHVRSERISYKQGEVKGIVAQGVRFAEKPSLSSNESEAVESVEQADVIVMATGFEKPSIDFLPSDLFPMEGTRNYSRPNLYLQTFSTEDWSILLTNSAYENAIAVVGNWHIGIYARILVVFLLERSTRPLPDSMKLWVDVINYIKNHTITSSKNKNRSGFAFFTYCELIIWMIGFHLFKFSRLAWLPFVLFGFGVRPRKAKEEERFERFERLNRK